jgi:hypothetical protein
MSDRLFSWGKIMANLATVQVLAGMTTAELEGARARLALMSDLEPGRDVAIAAIDSELLARDAFRESRARMHHK